MSKAHKLPLQGGGTDYIQVAPTNNPDLFLLGGYGYATREDLMALAEWIQNPNPLPTGWGAVIRDEVGNTYSLADPDDKGAEWRSEDSGWASGESLQARGFTVLFEGVQA